MTRQNARIPILVDVLQERSNRFWIAAIALVLLVTFADILFFGNTLYFRDIAREYYPTRRIFHDVVRAGSFPLWNARYAAGQPFAANPGYQAFYPIGILTLWLPDFDLAFRVEVMTHYFLAAFAMYALLLSCGLRRVSATAGAISWSMGGLLTALSNLLPFLFAAAWFPLLILFVRRYARFRGLRDFALSALVLGIILLDGDQSMILQAGCITFSVALYCSGGWEGGRGLRRAVVTTAAICAAALLVGVVQIVPALDFQRDCGRALPLAWNRMMQWSMSPLRPFEFFFPDLFGRFTGDSSFYWARRFHPEFPEPFLLSVYPSLFMTTLFAGGIVARVRAWPLAVTAVIGSYLIAIGSHGPLFPLIYAMGLRSIRYPEKFFIPAVLAVTILASFAFDDFIRVRKTALVTAFIVLSVAVSMSLFALTPGYARAFEFFFRMGPAAAAMDQSRIGWFLAALAAAICSVIIAWHGRVRPEIWTTLALLFIVSDLGLRNRGLMPRLPHAFVTAPPIASELMRYDGTPRIFNAADWQYFYGGTPRVPLAAGPWVVRNALLPRSYASWGLNGAIDLDITGTDLLSTAAFTRVFWSINRYRPDRLPILLRMAGITHVIEPQAMHLWRGTDLENFRPVTVTTIPGSRQYYFADQIVRGSGEDEFLRKLLAGPSWSARAAFVESALPAGKAEIVRVAEKPNAIDIDVLAAEKSLLVLAVTADKYWQASLDGRAVGLHRANLAFQSIEIPAGRHHVAMHYRNPLIAFCAALSLLCGLVLSGLALAGRGGSVTVSGTIRDNRRSV